MPELTIGDKTVTVGDEFLKLSPADQNAAVSHIAQQIGVGGPAAAAAPEAAPVSANDVGRSFASGVPIIGGALNQLNAATNAALAPVLNPLFDEKDQLKGATFADRRAESLKIQQGMDKTFSTEHPYVDTGAKLAGGIASMVPVMSAAPAAFGLTGPMSQMVRNGAISGAALSGADAAVRGEDIGTSAAVGGVIGGAAGPVGKGVGKVVSAIADRVRPPAPVAQNVASVGGVDIPLTAAEVTQNPALSAEQQIVARGGRGDAAQANATDFLEKRDGLVNQARDNFAAGLDPSGASARTAPQDAAEKIASELIAQEQGRQAAARGATEGAMSPAQTGDDLARSFGGGQVRAATPFDAAESLSDRLAAGRDAAKADYRGKYNAVAAAPGEFAPGSAGGFRADVEAGLRAGENPVSLDPTNTPKSLNALKIIDDNLNPVGPGARSPAAGLATDPEHSRNLADIRAKFGGDVAAAYDRQKAAAGVDALTTRKPVQAPDNAGPKGDFLPGHLAGAKPRYNLGQAQYQPEFASDVDKALYITAQTGKSARDAEYRAWLNARGYSNSEINSLGPKVRAAIKERASVSEEGPLPIARIAPAARGADEVIHSNIEPAAPKAQSLLEFIASKGGLGPDAEIEAIGGHSHTVNVEGVGRRKLVRQGGWPLDYAREAAQEAGYLHGDHNGTSTVNDLLDAMDAEMRGQKRYPQGFEGHAGKREKVAMSEREQHEHDAFTRGLEEELSAAGHGELGGDVRKRALQLMADEGATADHAVERAFHQLEQADAAAASHGASDFPGDRSPAAVAPKAAEAPGSGFTMRDVEQVRKQLSTLYGDARRAMMAGGSGADVHALENIMEHFGARVEKMIGDGKFAGDGPAVLKMQQDARASFADYKQKFAKRGAGDEVGAAVEKILGKFSDTRATPDTVVRLAYGAGDVPGGQMPVQIAQRIERIFGRNSPEFETYKQGLFGQLRRGDAEAAAGRIDAFLTEPKGRVLAQTVFSDAERASLGRHAVRLRGTAPEALEPGAAAAAIRRYSGADGSPPASANQIVNDLFGATGKGNGRFSVDLALRLKQSLTPDGWSAVRQGMFEKLTNAGEGKIQFEAQALSQRLHEFLNESGSQLAKALYSPRELEILKQMASVYKQMIPVKGTTNPSGTAPMLARMAGGLRTSLLPLLGLTHGGLPGAALGAAADRGLTAIGNANAARKATSLFYGEQAKRPVNPAFARNVGVLSKGSIPIEDQRRSRSK